MVPKAIRRRQEDGGPGRGKFRAQELLAAKEAEAEREATSWRPLFLGGRSRVLGLRGLGFRVVWGGGLFRVLGLWACFWGGAI